MFQMGASLKDIAERLNLSKTTVSWVLSGQGDAKGISEMTQQRVIQCAQELSYHPNLLARSLNTGVSKTIGLILPSISDSFYAHVANEIEYEAKKEGYSLMIASSNAEIERENAMIRLFRSKKVDGMVIAPTKISDREIVALANDRYPLVLFDRYFPDLNINHVIIDNEKSSSMLVRHLVEKGYRKIALITTNPHLFTVNKRREGYVNTLSDAGIHVDPNLYGEVPYINYKENIKTTLDRIFETVPDVDAFFFATHILAIEAFQYFHDKGIDISKGGIGLASMHSETLFRMVAPYIDIAHFPVKGIGKSTVQVLLGQIKAQEAGQEYVPQEVVVPCLLDLVD